MIISIIKQLGLRLRADPDKIPFQYSANVQMKFEKDENYNDYTVVGYYIPPGENEAKLLSINDDGTFILGPDCFKQRGILSFSFNLINSQEEIHLGSIDFEVRYAFGDSDTILPEPEEVWISLVTQVAKDAIKEDVELVKQKANEALQSASLANDKASEAKEYANNANQSAGSASLSASSALTAKNDAIAASNSAIQAKQDAEQSANNAKNSANTALENANKSTEAIETVTQIKTEIENKANDFDTNYQEKLKSFNDNATSKQNAFDNSVQTANTNLDNKVNQANSDLDAKVQEANTIIDEKVKTATEQAQKAKEEANRATQATDGKLDKNLGAENRDKVLITDAEGNIITQNKEDFEGGGTSDYNDLENKPQINGVELKGNKTSGDLKMYTQEEVDYLLADKMDKPYVPITITDNATIDDALAGNFKIDKIKGNTYQNVEENILPTPDRPVPINSRKVLSNGEYVELRSLKESVNKFDLGLLSQTYLIPQTGSYRKIEIPTKLKPSVRYTFYYENFMIPALSWLVLDIINSTGNIIFTAFNVNNKNNEEIEVNGRSVAFNAPSSGEIYFNYYVQSYDVEGNLVPQSTEMFKENWFTKYVKNIMITEESLNQTTYVAPTVRDYKIVDHENKTSKIVRNVGLYVDDHTGDSWTTYDNQTFQNSYFKNIKDMKRSNRILSYSNSFEVVNENTGVGNANSMWIGVTNSNVFVIRTDFKTIEEWKTWLKNNDLEFVYPLATPVEESIAYVETDVSEVGYSWQDTTSPSQTIKSEVQGVEEIDILKTGKNLFDIEGHEFTTNLQSGKVSANRIVKVNNTTLRIQNPNVESYAVGDKFVVKANDPLIISFDVLEITGTEQINVVFYKETGSLLKSFEYRTIKVGTRFVIDTPITAQNNYVYIGFQSVGAGFIVTISNILLEYASIATEYEPYKEQHINITLPQPMYSTADKKISDIANIENKQYEYYLKKVVFDGTNAMFTYLSNSNNVFYTSFLDDAISPYDINYKYILCEDLTVYPANFTTDNFVDNSIKYGNGSATAKLLFIKINDDITTVDRLYMWLKEHPITVYYVVQTPTTQSIPEDDLAKLKSLKTSAGVNNIFINGEVKPAIEARYPQDVVSAVNTLQTRLLTLQEEVIKNV